MEEKNLEDLSYIKKLIASPDIDDEKLMAKVARTQKSITDSVKDSVTINDEYGNTLTATGTDDKVKSFTNYGFSNDTLNWTLWTALYNDSWVFKRAIDKPSQDMVRAGITLNLDVEKSIKDDIYKEINKHRMDFIELIQWGKLYGGSIAVMMFDNYEDIDYSKPIDENKIKQSKVMRMYVTDRWYGCAPSAKTVNNMLSLDFGKPESYRVVFTDGKELLVHHDYVLRFENRTAPKLVKTGQLQGWGYAEGAHIINELSRDDQLKSAITSLVNKSLIEVIKMSGMRGVFMGADEENQTQLTKRLEMVNWARNFNSLTFLDKDDDYQQNQFSGLSGLSDLLEINMWLISAALEMQGVLYGDLKNGFSNDTEALERYDQTILNANEAYFRTPMEKFLHVLYIKYGINEKVDFTFNSLLIKKQDEDRIESLKHFQELISGMLNDGVLTPQQYAKALRNYTINGVIDFDITDESIEELKDKTEEEMENIDLGEEEENLENIEMK